MLFRARSSFPDPPIAGRRSRNDSGLSILALAVLLAVIAGGVIALVALLGGGRRTVADRSAAAFDEAARKGVPLGEESHGGHGAGGGLAEMEMEMPAGGKTAMPEHAGMGMPGQGEPETSGHGGHTTAGSTAGGSSPHAGMRHGTVDSGSTAATSPHAGMQHGTPAPRPGGSQAPASGAAGHAGHGATQQPPAGTTGSPQPAPLAKSAVASPGQPAATLEPDSLDLPALTSQIDAKRAAEIAAQPGHGMAHGTGSYRQIDAGRESVPQAPPAMPAHPGMDHGPQPDAAPKPATARPRPAVTPAPTPGGHVHPGGGPR